MADLRQLTLGLRSSVLVLSQLNLYQAAKWSAEALNALSAEEDGEEEGADAYYQAFDQLSHRERDRLMLAKTYFDCKEFDRCAHVVKKFTSPVSMFVRLYAMFISGEKKKEEESEGVLGQNDNSSQNLNIPIILKELELYFSETEESSQDPFLLFLYGVILLKQKSIHSAQQALMKSIQKYPLNWSCWLELISSIDTLDHSISIYTSLHQSSSHTFVFQIMLKFFKIVINQEFFQQSDNLYQELDQLVQIFPDFAYLQTQKALISYHALEYQDAEDIFDDILTKDPLRLDDLDTYSNILYVMDKRSKLSYLAQLSCSIDKFRPETCCIIANYYSLKFEHEKAIMYYRRALTLNRNCLSAWTLMGHEFVELKNSHAAIESYRRAIDTNNKDFKAWYGLGQAYEVLDMHLYSLFYYQTACRLRPLDKRIWQALGNCFEKLKRYKDAIKSYQKALELNNEIGDVVIYYKLALLFEFCFNKEKMYEFMKLCYLEEINNGARSDETAKARLWLARYEMDLHNWEGAYQYAMDLNHGTSQEIEEARSITREARNRMNLQ